MSHPREKSKDYAPKPYTTFAVDVKSPSIPDGEYGTCGLEITYIKGSPWFDMTITSVDTDDGEPLFSYCDADVRSLIQLRDYLNYILPADMDNKIRQPEQDSGEK
ncbi:hypothetical protein [Vreelandella indica]|uniref:hypothetical protein n=1 Tax=Vreelandella indica TaxID=3126500 RepID=UPI00300DF50D